MVGLIMKKRLLLAVLPALLVLSGCKSPYSMAATNVKTFAEDTLAHEEIFGKAEEANYFSKLRNPYKSVHEDEDFPMAYQIHFDDKGDDNDANDVLSIRFIAAVKNLGVTAAWKRGVAAADGSEPRSKSFSNSAQPATKYYKALSDGNDTLEVQKGGRFNDYAGFVVYTIHDIPYKDNKNAYVAAYLTLTSEADGEDCAQSDILAVKIEMEDEYTSANAFTFSSTKTQHFLQGKINNTVKVLPEDKVTASGSYWASYSDVELLTTDYFGSFYYAPTIFQYFGNGTFCDTSRGFFNESTLSGYSSPIMAGTYDIFISSSYGNHIYASADSLTGKPKIYLDASSDWTSAGASIGVYTWGPSGNAWYKMEKDLVKTSLYVLDDYDVSKATGGFKFARMDPSYAVEDYNFNNPPCWTESCNWDYGRFYNNDSNKADAGPGYVCKITGWNSYSYSLLSSY